MSLKNRLDSLLVDRGFFMTRSQAKAAIMAGKIKVNGIIITKAGFSADSEDQIEIQADASIFVSRGGDKLAGAIEHFKLDFIGKTVLDAGASTGGFTDLALKLGAARVFAVDVGYGQFDWRLRQDPRVSLYERTNIREVTNLPLPIDIAVIDLSFISLTKVIDAIIRLLSQHGAIVALVKPQFEAGKSEVGKGGVVRDPAVHEQVLVKIWQKLTESGLKIKGLTPSTLRGPKGNIEFFFLAVKNAVTSAPDLSVIKQVVAEAHNRSKEDRDGE